MLFNSFSFLVFFAIFYTLYLIIKKQQYRIFLCLLGSYIFYGWWDWRFLSLIIFSTVVDFYLGSKIHTTNSQKNKKKYLYFSLMTNLGLLFTFKYFNFFIQSFVDLSNTIGLNASVSSLNIILPVGISFYTFQTLSYTIDIYNNNLKPEKDFMTFATFVAFFPQLVAGPIVRAIDLLPQFKKKIKITTNLVIDGLFLVAIGFFKKIVIADSIAPLVDDGFLNNENYSSLNLIIIVILYSFQIYSDFSGYSDIAIGIGKMLGYKFPVNFNLPYISKNLSDFWKRWHISLSSWLRDYLYIPLGGNKSGVSKTYRNLMLTMLIGGLWHGANWTFVIWGALHGSYLIIQKLISRKNMSLLKLLPVDIYNFIGILITYFLVCLAWIFFRSQSFSEALNIIGSIYEFNDFNFSSLKPKFDLLKVVSLVCILYFSELIFNKNQSLFFKLRHNRVFQYIFFSSILLFIILFGSFENNNFIYFQF